jgi:hypothetical protein
LIRLRGVLYGDTVGGDGSLGNFGFAFCSVFVGVEVFWLVKDGSFGWGGSGGKVKLFVVEKSVRFKFVDVDYDRVGVEFVDSHE